MLRPAWPAKRLRMAKPATRRPREPAAGSPEMSAGALCCSATPALDDDLRLGKAVEDFPVEKLIAQLRVEALAVAVLPWAARLDVGGPGANGGDPVPRRIGHELGAIAHQESSF